MMVSGSVSVPSATNEHLTISVNGLSTLNYATAFANTLNAANTSGTLLISDLDSPLPAPGSASGDTVEYTVLNAGESGTIPTAGAYLLDATPGSSTVTGSGGGDTVLAAVTYGDGGISYLDQGGNNDITFVSGNNSYIAQAQGLSTPNDTITTGSGQDNIITGAGNATVFSGTGSAHIALNDEGEGGTSEYDDVAVLGGGLNTVSALGASDLIAISAPGQVIYCSANPATTALVVISAGGSNVINAAAGNLIISDAVGGNIIDGGTGLLTIAANPVATGNTLLDTITSSTGSIDMFGADGTYFTLASTTSDQQDLFVAGTGSETLSGAASSSTLTVFANATGTLLTSSGSGLTKYIEGQDSTGATIYDTIIGGSGALQIFGGNDNDLTLAQGGAAGILYVAGADGETIQASGVYAPMTVFGGNGGNMSIQGGSGPLLFVGGTSFAEIPSSTIAAGSGGTVLFGNDGDVLTLVTGSPGNATFVAGQGNETLDASAFSGNLGLFAYNPADPIDGGNVNESILGGSGSNDFFTGAGYETFVAGTGGNSFQIDSTHDGLGGTITIYNYASSDPISFGGFTQAEETAAVKSAAPAADGVVGTQITLSDQTTVLFVDTTASELNFKL